MTMNAGLPSEARVQLNDFLDQANVRSRLISETIHTEMGMLAKGMALQQAGIIPADMELDSLKEKAASQMDLEGLR